MSGQPQGQFLRRYSLTVKTNPDDVTNEQTVININSDDEPHALRVTFDVQTMLYSGAVWTAQIVIYNLGETVSNLFLTQAQGMAVTLEAGYYGQGANYGLVWDGYVLQVLWERERQTDFKTTLNCVVGLDPTGMMRNLITMAYSTALTQAQIVQKMANDCFHKIPVGPLTGNLDKTQLPRGKVLFGSPKKFLNEIARDNNSQWWVSHNNQLNMVNPNADLPTTTQPTIRYTPATGIVGTPTQTQTGVNFTVLLNPNVAVTAPPMSVGIDNTQVRQLLKQIGQYPGILSTDGVYGVFGVRHHGDTRGQEWYTDVTGVTIVGGKLISNVGLLGALLATG